MSDDHDASRVKERPVEPPVIDVEAEASEATQEPEQPAGPAGDAPSPAPETSPWRRRLLVACSVLVLAGAALWAFSANGFRLQRDDGRLAAMEQRIESLETAIGATTGELAELAKRATDMQSAVDKVSSQAPAGLDELRSRIDAVESSVQNAQRAIETAAQAPSGGETAGNQLAAVTAKIGEVEQKLAALERAGASSEASESKSGELSTAFASLATALEAGQPFPAELEKIAGISPTLSGLEELKPHAATGAPSVADLALRLQTIHDREAPALAPAQPAEGQGVWAGVRSRIAGLVSIRDLEQARWIDGMAAASRQLAQGDLQQALATLQAIEGPPPEELKAWLAEAEARAAVNRAARAMAEAVGRETGGTP